MLAVPEKAQRFLLGGGAFPRRPGWPNSRASSLHPPAHQAGLNAQASSRPPSPCPYCMCSYARAYTTNRTHARCTTTKSGQEGRVEGSQPI